MKRLANRLIRRVNHEHQGGGARFLRRLFAFIPTVDGVIWYQAGHLTRALGRFTSGRFSSLLVPRISERIQEQLQALENPDAFLTALYEGQSSGQSGLRWRGGSELSVLGVINSCAVYDQNGYAVRSERIHKALQVEGINMDWLARLGYPWDIAGRASWDKVATVDSPEGCVRLCHDPRALLGGMDSRYWQTYADYIESHIEGLEQPPSVLHAFSKYSNGIAAALAGRRLGVPVIYEMRGLWHLTRAQGEPVYANSEFCRYEEQMELGAARMADHVVAISESLRDWLVARGVKRERISVVPNAPPPEMLTGDQEGVAPPEPSAGVLRLAFMGSLTSYEGLDVLIEALEMVGETHPGITLDVYGDGGERKGLEEHAHKRGLGERVRFHGRRPFVELKARFTDYDLFPIVRTDSAVTRLIPPLKHMEAMAASRPVLISALPALLESVPEELAALAVPPGDVQALAERLKQLADEPQLLIPLAQAGQRWVREARSWETNARTYLKLYERLMCPPGGEEGEA